MSLLPLFNEFHDYKSKDSHREYSLWSEAQMWPVWYALQQQTNPCKTHCKSSSRQSPVMWPVLFFFIIYDKNERTQESWTWRHLVSKDLLNHVVLFGLQVDVQIIPTTLFGSCGSNTGITSVMMCAGVLQGGKDSCQVRFVRNVWSFFEAYRKYICFRATLAVRW